MNEKEEQKLTPQQELELLQSLDRSCKHTLQPEHCVYCNPDMKDTDEVMVITCQVCQCGTWHKNATCMKCGRKALPQDKVWFSR